ncbi:MAG: hypothetical protein RLZZ546_3247 [Bacteroidota bacterium]|jgi:hypothetical protein
MSKNILILFVLFIIFQSCKNDKSDTAPNVDHISSKVNLIRFDKILFEIDTLNFEKSIEKIKNQYPAFYALYFNQVLPLAADTSINFRKAVSLFNGNAQIQKLRDTTWQVIGNLNKYEQELNQSIKYLKYYMPEYKDPNIYTFISEFGFQKFIFADGDRDGIGIGLEFFLGETYPYKNLDPTNPAFSDYLTRTFNKDHITSKTMETIVSDLVGEPMSNKLIDQMIHNGKKLFILEKILPFIHDSVIYEYTPAQLKWVNENEVQMWSFFGEKNLFYETNIQKINKYINPSPHSPDMPIEAPGKTANYLGKRIIESYIKKFPNTTWSQLLQIKDGDKILKLSQYKPKRR